MMMKTEVCLVKIEEPLSEQIVSLLLPYVTPRKRNRILRQQNKHKADLMLVGEILAKYMIKKFFGIHFQNQCFGYGVHGKPYLKNRKNIHFNISHSGNFVLCAVADREIGADIQQTATYNPRLADRCFSPMLCKQFEKDTHPDALFTKAWARREAVQKCAGEGMFRTSMGKEYQLFEYKIEDYFIAVAMEKE